MAGNISAAITWAVNTANDDTHGYIFGSHGPTDYDCSGFVLQALTEAGFDIGSASYTGDMETNLTAHGFRKLSASATLQAGDILLNTANHTALYIGNNQLVEAASDRGNPETGDQTGTEIYVRAYYSYPWDMILRANSETLLDYYDYDKVLEVWNLIQAATNNEYGTAGLMGNLYAESGICPYRCEGMDYDESLTETNDVYKNFDNASDFALHYTTSYIYEGETYYGRGYSLAQWTTQSRKEGYYNYVGQANIGDNQKSVEYLLHELQTSYPAVWQAIINATTVESASTYVLRYYEIPRNWQSQVSYRKQLGESVYQDFTGIQPTPTKTKSSLPIYLKAYRIIIK